MPARLVVAEDDRKQADVLRRYLEAEGYAVLVVHDGRSAIDTCRRRLPDLVVLDVMMPRVDGLDVCRVLRAECDVPIIMLTARSTEDDMLLGFDLGADDYLTKPYSPRELLARVRSLLRRTRDRRTEASETLQVGELIIDLARHEVRVAGQLIDCTPAELKILAQLASQPGRVFTRQQLLTEAFGFDHESLDRTIDVHIGNLRRKIEPVPARPTYLLTVYGVGYKMSDTADTPTADTVDAPEPDAEDIDAP